MPLYRTGRRLFASRYWRQGNGAFWPHIADHPDGDFRHFRPAENKSLLSALKARIGKSKSRHKGVDGDK